MVELPEVKIKWQIAWKYHTKSIMKTLIVLLFFFCLVYCKKESVSDLYDMLNDPRILSEIEKRLKLLDEDSEQYSDEQIGCDDKSGTIGAECHFTASSDLIIKTNESLQRGAEFLDEIDNVSCPKECTEYCCKNENCDTAVYQDKVSFTGTCEKHPRLNSERTRTFFQHCWWPMFIAKQRKKSAIWFNWFYETSQTYNFLVRMHFIRWRSVILF